MDAANDPLTDPKQLADRPLLQQAAASKEADLQSVTFSEFGSSVLYAPWRFTSAPLVVPIAHVICDRAVAEVFRIDTGRVVAGVPTDVRPIPVLLIESHPMGELTPSLVRTDSVSLFVRSASPLYASRHRFPLTQLP
jgi:hypothetical protein